MSADEYLDAIEALSMKSGRTNDIAHFLVGFTAARLTNRERKNAIEQARKIYDPSADR